MHCPDVLVHAIVRNAGYLKFSTGHEVASQKFASDDIAEQLLRGQELVDLLWKIPPRISVDDARRILQISIKQSSLRLSVDEESSSSSSQVPSGVEQEWHLLRLPVDPQVKIGGIDYRKVKVKRSAEAPIIITCTGVNREEEEAEVTANSSVKSQRNTWSSRTIMNFLHHYNGHRTLGEIYSSFRDSLAAYTVITFLLGVGDRHSDNMTLSE
ncbi:hypothetical protein PsorP6_002026 [Peronosclerospora sorghi]|uniref:Uncharacterized protein n=1 Tax=Peronosclerospora sorghi TaxID=230839 RepID=A0ACC0WVE4_9STRA|nr:hypothetical protein PsorP6_002026 [Peronosclerospora sorghi]